MIHTPNRFKAFTLIELLVVIAIIGILSAIVLASLNTAHEKGQDAAVQADIDGARTQAQIYYSDHNSGYGINANVESDCNATDNMFSNPTILKQVSAADTANGIAQSVTCNVAAKGTAYAISAGLVADPNNYYCVDNTGSSIITGHVLGADETVCQ